MGRALGLVLLVVVLGGSSSARANELTLVVLPPESGEPRPGSASLVALGDALREAGATVLAPGDYQAAAEEQGIEPERRRQPESIRAVSTVLGLTGVVSVWYSEPPPIPPSSPGDNGVRRGMRQQVFAANGDLVWDGQITLVGDELSPNEAGALASFAVQALIASPDELRQRSLEGEVLIIADEAIRPSPRALALTRLGAEITLNFRDASTRPPGQVPIDFDTSAPYVGAAVRFDSFPLPASWGGRILGLGLEYAYSSARVSVGSTTGRLSEPASDHRFLADLIGRFALDEKNRFILRGGFAYQTFLIEQSITTAAIDHTSAHLAMEFERVLPAGLEVWLRGGVRPFSRVGRDFPGLFGDDATSIGWEARFTLTGRLDSILPDFRWTAGYDYLEYSDRFSSAAGMTPHVERYHRLFLGVIWARG